MQHIWSALKRHPLLSSSKGRVMLLFALEGVLIQYISSINGFGNNLYATNMGASDVQIGLVQTVANMTAVLLLLPSGLIGERLRSPRTLPVFTLALMGVMYFFYGSVPAMGSSRIAFFFVFLAATSGLLAVYNAQWQTFFGDVITDGRDRNGVYAFRNRFMFFIGTCTPLLCGAAMSSCSAGEEKLQVLRVFYYTCGAAMLLAAVILRRMPVKDRPRASEAFSLADAKAALSLACRSRAFRSFFVCILFFYLSWHIDWSMWYIAQIQYCGMTELHMSVLNALACVGQLLTIGVFVRLNQRHGVGFSFLFGVGGLMLCPFTVCLCLNLPLPVRPAVFTLLAALFSAPQSCIGLCVIQMLLSVVPERGRSFLVSLYTLVILLSNSVLPLLGVQLYTLLGANAHALFTLNVCVLLWRAAALAVFIVRYLRERAPSARARISA